jgi:hypothetical protein
MLPAPDSPLAPKYWLHETDGKLASAIKRYLNGEGLSVDDILLIRAYLRQWIDSPVWDQNPHMNDNGRRVLAEMRFLVKGLKNRADLDRWIGVAVDQGMDPL